MFYPIGDDQVHKGYTPYFSRLFLGINILVFIYQASLSPVSFQLFVTEFGSIPKEIVAGHDMFTLLTNMFLHGSWMHLIGNMLYLYVFGDNIEASIGSRSFFMFYILGGIAASVAHVVFNLGSSIPAVGASGAISAVLGAYLVMFPTSKIKMLSLYNMRTMLVPAGYFLFIWIGMQIFSGVGAEMSSGGSGGGVARWAHIGGFIFGRFAGRVFKKNANLDLIRK